ncbi:ABC transporter ATP-binding protein [Frigidibacter sp. MR17.24]|uniref:ABC transporter ATP-binding protein n=1 Tax=Frigidibacter sp. MR17.24 TaxID=3127345 RepID=UPI003012C35B
MAPHSLTLSGIGKGFGSTEVLKGIDLAIRPGEFLSLVGMSGCGKSTLLRIIAGLETADRGQVAIGGTDVTGVDPTDRNLAMVFQSYALYPHMTVRENIATPLRMRELRLAQRLPLIGRLLTPPALRARIAAAVEEAAETLQIATLLDRRPAQLSGGQRQRVALARALVRQPAAFLMDEPLSNLDAKLRAHMRDELAALHRRLGATFVYVTHDQVEAMTMSDRIALMSDGRIEQLGTPDELYRAPVNLTVARFIGAPTINLIPVEADAGGDLSAFGQALMLRAPGPGPATLGLRAEDLRIAAASDAPGFDARVLRSETHGADRFVTCAILAATDLTATLRQPVSAGPAPAAGARVRLGFAAQHAHLFDADGCRKMLRSAAGVAA